MKFYDRANILVYSGSGWNWMTCWRREAKVPYGWPDGWDWGRWGDVVFLSSKDENTLLKFRYAKEKKAEDGKDWMGSSKNWRDWEDLVLYVPIWTLLKDKNTWEILYSFTEDNEKFVFLRGGRWWFWNKHFKSSTNQYPEFSLYGEPNQKKEISMELQLFGDIALIWKPSVWKSTLINSVSNAKAKVADYPFTTIVPNLGMVDHKWEKFCMVDIPWLIEWAGIWKGLGFEFLRHTLKSRIWCFMLDLSDADNIQNQFIVLLEEIMVYIKNRYLDSYDYWEKIDDVLFDLDDDFNFYVNIVFETWEKLQIFHKKITFFFNKIDFLDEELVEDVKIDFVEKIKKYLSKNFSWNYDNLINNIYTWAAAAYIGIDKFLDFVIDILPNLEKDFEEFKWVSLDILEKEKNTIINNITESHMDMLLEEGYIEDETLSVWQIEDETFAYYAYVLPWWNLQAEDWFWKKMTSLSYLNLFEKKWIKKGDVIKIISPYEWVEDMFISYD